MKCPECGGETYYDSTFCEHVCVVCGLVVATSRTLLYIKAIVRGIPLTLFKQKNYNG